MNKVEKIVTRLQGRGFDAYIDFGPSPTEFVIKDERTFSFACGFNVDGWEAQVERTEGSAEGLEDGPGASASVDEIVTWAAWCVETVPVA